MGISVAFSSVKQKRTVDSCILARLLELLELALEERQPMWLVLAADDVEACDCCAE
jgi:hypothetical protein